jgi:hypothetical protein
MCKPKRNVLLALSSALVLALLLGLVYAYQRSKFIQKVNAAFDPQQKAFRGVFLPWPVGRPTLAVSARMVFDGGRSVLNEGMDLSL